MARRVMTTRRLPVLVVIVLAIGALILADRSSSNSVASDSVASDALMPVASPPGAVSSAFFCAGGAATAGAVFDSTIVVANPGQTAANVLVTSYPGALSGDVDGAATVAKLAPVTKQVSVGARGRAEVTLASLQASPFAAAVVETNDADIAVERRVTNPAGDASSSPCASAPSDTWYFPTGTTTRDARELLAVFNPFPVDAVVNITFQTSDGFRNPGELQSLPVPGGQLRVLDISALVPRIEQLATTVSSVSGRVIVDRLQSFDGTDPNHPAGVAATVGAPAAADVWTFGEGEVGDGLNEVFTVMNPSAAPVNSQLEVMLDAPDTNGAVDPIPLTIPARGYAQVVMRDETRIPKNVAHSVIVRSSGVGLIAERTIGASAPAARRGYAPALGAPLVATRWLFADGRAVANETAEFLIVVNPSLESIAHLRFSALAGGQLFAIDGLQDVEVPPGGRINLQLAQHISRDVLPVLVEADRPVVVERGMYAGKGKGISLAAGIPIPDAAALPAAVPTTTTTTIGVPPPSS